MENAHPFYEMLAQWSEILGGIAFVVAAYLLFRKFMLPVVQSAAIARNAELVNAERRREALRAEVAGARGELEAATRDGLAIRERGRTDAERERERIIQEARHEGERLIHNAQGELDRARIAARDELRIELIEKALNRARAIAHDRIDETVNARLVAKTVDELAGGTR